MATAASAEEPLAGTPGRSRRVRGPILRELLRPYPRALPALSALGLVASLAEGIGIGLLIPFLNTLLDEQPGSVSGPFVEWAQAYADWMKPDTVLYALAATIFVLIVIKAAVVFAHEATGDWLNGRVAHDLRMRLIRQLLDVEYRFVQRQPAGRLLDTLQEHTKRAGDAVSCVATLIVTGATISVFSVLLLLTSWRLTLGFGAGVALATLLLRGLSQRAKRLGSESVEASKSLSSCIVAVLDGMRMIRAYGQEEREWRRLADISDGERRAYVHTDITAAAVTPLMEVLYVPLFLGALVLAWRAGTTLPVLLTCLVLFYRLQPKIQQFLMNRTRLSVLLASVEDVQALLRTDDKPFLTHGHRSIRRLEHSVRFHEVGFRYTPEARHAVRNVSFEIPRGAMVAVVGGSGAGKSTLVNLLFRFYDPQEGRIVVDDCPLADLDPSAWRKRIAIAGQDADLLSGTIAENIRFGKPDASQQRIVRAAKRAEADAFIEALPDGYDSMVGARGLSLSAGQRQRIGLARALVRDPCLLVLDEATSALDNPTSAAILSTVDKLRGQLTILMIAHRLENVFRADDIVVLLEGSVVERGRPDELLRKQGLFAHLYLGVKPESPRDE